MRPSDIGELIGMDVFNASQLSKELRLSKLIEWASKSKHLYRITEKGKKYKANPPAEIEADMNMPAPPSSKTSSETAPPQPPAPEEKPEAEKDEAMGIPSGHPHVHSGAIEHHQNEGWNPAQRHNQLCPADGRVEQTSERFNVYRC